ncbi:unnamed protein product [Clavelina lepadiformis]|uniref:Uncharacterized protein n=1 Tax=Clavelina lepadiformis TaxID=159417 RepID=A0ABP0FRU1_CLALP
MASPCRKKLFTSKKFVVSEDSLSPVDNSDLDIDFQPVLFNSSSNDDNETIVSPSKLPKRQKKKVKNGGGKRKEDSEKQKAIVQRIVADCSFSNLSTFDLDVYKAKHLEPLNERKCQPSTFIAHNVAVVGFLKFIKLQHPEVCKLDFPASFLRLKQWNQFYRRNLQQQYVFSSFKRFSISTAMDESPGTEHMRGYGELLFAILTFENAQRPSAIRGMLVEEAKEVEKSSKGFYVIRVRIAGHIVGFPVSQIVVRPAVKDALFTFIHLAPGQKFVFEWRGEQWTSSHAAKALQRVCSACVPKGRNLTATKVRKCTATQIRAKNPGQREMVAGHMAHLISTQETHYINPLQCDESVVAYEAIQSLNGRDTEIEGEQAHQGESSSSVPNPPSPDGASSQHSPASHSQQDQASPDRSPQSANVAKSRKQFTKEESEEVLRCFGKNIKERKRIFIREARVAMEEGSLSLCATKSAKQIQDRVAEFIRSEQRREKENN